MFNYNIYHQHLESYTQLENLKKSYIFEKEKKQHANKRMAQNYRKRVENFIVNMLEKPIIYKEYDPPNKVESSFIGDAQIYVKGFKHESERVREAEDRNKNLDICPHSEIIKYQFRTRDVSKELHSDMRFNDKTRIEHIQQYLKDHTQTQVVDPNWKQAKQLKVSDNFAENMSAMDKRAYISKQIALNMLPQLHQKTHFKAAQDMYNNLPLCLVESISKVSLPKIVKDPDMDESVVIPDIPPTKESLLSRLNKDKKKSQLLDIFDPRSSSKSVLLNCNVIKRKNPKVKVLRIGAGHMSNSALAFICD